MFNLFSDKKLYKKIFKNLSIISASQIILQLLGLISNILIVRKIGPENAGLLSTTLNYIAIFSFFNISGTSRIIIREGAKKKENLQDVINKITGIKLLFAVVSILLTNISLIFINSYTNDVKLIIIIYSFYHIIEIYSSYCSSIYQAVQDFKTLSIFSILYKIFYILLGTVAVYLGGNVLILILINLLTSFVVLLINLRNIRKIVEIKLLSKLIWDRNILYPSLTFTALFFLGYLQTRIDILMVSWMGNMHEVGIYSIAYILVEKIVAFRAYISTIIFPMLAERMINGKISFYKYLSFTLILFISALVLSVIISVNSSLIISVIYGNSYTESATILSTLIFYIVFSFASLLFTNTILSINKENNMLVFSLLTSISNIILNYIFYHIFGLIGIAYSTLISFGLVVTAYFFYSIYLLKSNDYFKN